MPAVPDASVAAAVRTGACSAAQRSTTWACSSVGPARHSGTSSRQQSSRGEEARQNSVAQQNANQGSAAGVGQRSERESSAAPTNEGPQRHIFHALQQQQAEQALTAAPQDASRTTAAAHTMLWCTQFEWYIHSAAVVCSAHSQAPLRVAASCNTRL